MKTLSVDIEGGSTALSFGDWMLLPLNAFSFVHSHTSTVVRTARTNRGVELGCLVQSKDSWASLKAEGKNTQQGKNQNQQATKAKAHLLQTMAGKQSTRATSPLISPQNANT